MTTAPDRRPIRSRTTGWARALAGLLAGAGASPDLISAAGVACQPSAIATVSSATITHHETTRWRRLA